MVDILLPSLERLFNDSIIKPVYKKKGDKKITIKLRGITLTSYLGNLLTSILQCRLTRYIYILKRIRYNKSRTV